MKAVKYASLILLLILVHVGCSQPEAKSTKGNKTTPAKTVIPPVKQKAPAEKLDKFGRSPSHPHYGHNHAVNKHPQQNGDSTVQSTDGKPDKYGRKPGHPHYGHNHK